MTGPEGGGRIRPGEVLLEQGSIALNPGRPVTVLRVVNSGDRPVQVGSHFHFAAANAALEFDRAAASGQRLSVAAGTAVRFEPGIDMEVELVPIGGDRIVPGLQTGGDEALDAEALDAAARDDQLRDAELGDDQVRDAGARGGAG